MRLCPIMMMWKIMPKQLLLLLFLPLLILIRRPENQIHNQHLISKHQRYKYNGHILLLPFHSLNKNDDQISIIKYFPKYNSLIDKQLHRLSLSVTYQRIIDIRHNNLSNIYTTSYILHKEITTMLIYSMTTKDLEIKIADRSYQ